MKKVLCFLALFPLCVWAQINKEGDFQIWNLNSLTKNLTEKSALLSQSEFRYGDDASKLYLAYTQLQWVYNHKWLTLAPGYRQVFVRDEFLKWFPVYAPIVDVFFTIEKKKITLEDRNRCLYLLDKKSNHWVYRNRIRFSYDVGYFSLYGDEEVFFVQKRGIVQNRFSVGIYSKWPKGVATRLFYLIRHLREEKWVRQNVLGLYLYLNF